MPEQFSVLSLCSNVVLKFAQSDSLYSDEGPLFYSRAVVAELVAGGERSLGARPSRVSSGALHLLPSPPPPPLPRCCCCQPSRFTALHRAVTKLDDALPHGLQHRCESRSTTPAPHLSNRPSH